MAKNLTITTTSQTLKELLTQAGITEKSYGGNFVEGKDREITIQNNSDSIDIWYNTLIGEEAEVEKGFVLKRNQGVVTINLSNATNINFIVESENTKVGVGGDV